MSGCPASGRARAIVGGLLAGAVFIGGVGAQGQPQIGGAYAGREARRQAVGQNWVERFNKTTGQKVEPGPFYDDILSLSTKTTFDAVTHALMTTVLTDTSGAALGDALS